ncbi:hypothetical protein RGQ29_027035 [Quercus rubra]|uniref:PROP1-like PPR domain-containing protein n=1 Tax=Quercus rubra TaxID=3512 RepID=A0AAN7EP31_QUERU|nr:hypothetical protein RGQ29_027035 [Quercus rubra]
MPASKAKNLSSLFRTAVKTTTTTAAAATATATSSSSFSTPAQDATLKHFVSSVDTSSSPTASISNFIKRRCVKVKSPKSSSSRSTETSFSSSLPILNLEPLSDSEDSTKQLSREISSILSGGESLSSPNLQGADDGEDIVEKVLNIPWFSNLSHNHISLHRKEVSRERKQKWVYKSSQGNRFNRLVSMCGQKLGTETTIQVFGKLGRETGVKEYNALIGLCVQRVRRSDDEDAALEQIHMAFRLFESMREQGFQIEEDTYGQFLLYLIEMGMEQEFHFFCGVIGKDNPRSLPRLGYYEMLLWIGVNNEEKIQELCKYIAVDNGGDNSALRENYLLALCESDRKKELLQLLEIVDIMKLSPPNSVANIFRSLGRLSLESSAENFLMAFKNYNYEAENISNFISSYVVSIPNLAVEDVISKFKNFHAKLEVTPSSSSYAELITYCCDSLKVHAALDLVDEMCEVGLTLSIEVLHSILHATEESCEFNLVRRIYSVICHQDMTPNNETFRSMINLCVRMKDYEGAYGMLEDLEKMNLTPTANMYNAIMAGYFRDKNTYGALMVLRKMELADVKPDSQTFSYLISNCDCEEDIIKYYEELKHFGVQVTRHIFMALINAYANCGQFEKAKQEHLQSDGELSRLLQLLKELKDADYWVDGCCRLILYCVRYKHLSSAVDLLKQMKDNFCNDDMAIEVLFDEVFSQVGESEFTHLQIGLDLLQVIKDELCLSPSRKCLDFLLNACVNAKDLQSSLLIWKEYQAAGLPYNVLSFLRMYQVLLASGEHKAAKILLNKIPKDDIHVRCVIKACQTSYIRSMSTKGKKKNKVKKKG